MLIPFKNLLSKYNIKPTGVFHIGASIGQEANDYFNSGVENVVWIEAIPYIFQELLNNIEKYPGNIAFNECISDSDGETITFNISSHGAQSSSILQLGTHKTDHPEVRYVSSISAKTKRIDTLLEEHQLTLSNYDFLNIDLQGAELLALKGIGEEFKNVRYAYIEVNKAELYIGCPLIKDIDDLMWIHGLHRVETEWCGNFGWGDAFYVKKEL